MKDKLIQLLSSFGYPVTLQGSIAQDEKYPESFFTFWNSETYDGSHYNNSTIAYIWDFTINFYSNNPQLVNTVPLEAIALLRQNGWIISGRGYDVPSDEPSHTGRAFDALYIEKN
jgi:hypothetical protein